MIASKTYISYLAAKKRVDDRALNRYVWQELTARLRPMNRKTLRVIEFGAGIGTMLERVTEWGISPRMHYTMVDLNPDYLDAFRSRYGSKPLGRSDKSQDGGFEKAVTPEMRDEPTVEIICADLYDVIADPQFQGRWDLIIAHAVMDLVDAGVVLAGFARLAKPGGLLYLSLIYDGLTEFLPSEDSEFEHELIDRYHLSMDRRSFQERCSSGSGRAARGLFSRLKALDMPILAAGSSDWVVFPINGHYPTGEAFFLDTIIDTIDLQMKQDPTMDPDRLAAWTARKHAMVKAGELTYIARNMDFLAGSPSCG